MRALLALVVAARAAGIAEETIFDVPALERVFDERLARLKEYSDPLFPADLEVEAVSALQGLARLNPESAVVRARQALEMTTSSGLAWTARKALVREGDLGTIRRALLGYFEDEEHWGDVLSGSDDPRLADFRPDEDLESPVSRRHFLSTLEWNLSRARSGGAVRALVRWAESSKDPESPRRVLGAIEKGTPYDLRIERWLARNPPIEGAEPIRRVIENRGRVLAAVVLSETVSLEEKRFALAAMRDARAEAVSIPATGLAEAMISLAGEEAMKAFIEETDALAALAALPLPEARERLESIGTPEAIESLMKRHDRVASMPFLERARRSSDSDASHAAELALLSLGAPGSSAFLRRELAAGERLEELLAPISIAPVDPALALPLLSAVAPSPAGFAALASFQERYPASFFSWSSRLTGSEDRLRERAHFVLSFSADARRVPLLVDLAVGGAETSPSSREAAFAALADADLGPFAARLHRLAGDPDRTVRFRVAAALVPSGDPWTLRLLLAELDRSSVVEKRIARRAVARLPPERARALLGEMVFDQTAGAFGVLLFLGLDGEASHRDLWAIVRDGALAGDETSLLVASLLRNPEAIACVTRFLTMAKR